jgi:hypothetical protein
VIRQVRPDRCAGSSPRLMRRRICSGPMWRTKATSYNLEEARQGQQQRRRFQARPRRIRRFRGCRRASRSADPFGRTFKAVALDSKVVVFVATGDRSRFVYVLRRRGQAGGLPCSGGGRADVPTRRASTHRQPIPGLTAALQLVAELVSKRPRWASTVVPARSRKTRRDARRDRRPHGPVAFLATELALYGRLCPYAALGRATRLTIEAFRNWNDAQQWLTVKLKEETAIND